MYTGALDILFFNIHFLSRWCIHLVDHALTIFINIGTGVYLIHFYAAATVALLNILYGTCITYLQASWRLLIINCYTAAPGQLMDHTRKSGFDICLYSYKDLKIFLRTAMVNFDMTINIQLQRGLTVWLKKYLKEILNIFLH